MYLIWGILPFVLLMMTIWAFIKPYLKVRGRENAGDYFKMFLFSAAIMAAAILANEAPQAKEAVTFLTFGYVELEMFSILIYPAFLFFGAKISDYLKSRTQ